MALKTIDLGPVSSYAIAVEKGYTGTEQEWYELIHSITEKAQAASDAAVSAEESAASAAQALVDIGTEKATAIADIQQEGADQKADVTAEGAAQIANVDAAKDLAVAAVQAQQGTSVQAVYDKGTEQESRVEDAGDAAVGDVTDEKDDAIAAVQAKGEEVIASIPSDYTELTEEVSGLKSAINNTEKNILNETALFRNVETPNYIYTFTDFEQGYRHGRTSVKVDSAYLVSKNTLLFTKGTIVAPEIGYKYYFVLADGTIYGSIASSSAVQSYTFTEDVIAYIEVNKSGITGYTLAITYRSPITTTLQTVATLRSEFLRSIAIQGSFVSATDRCTLSDCTNLDKVYIQNKNLLPILGSASATDHEITKTVNSDGSISLSGTANGTAVFAFTVTNMPPLKNGDFTLSLKNSQAFGDDITYLQLSINGNYSADHVCRFDRVNSSISFKLSETQVVTGFRIRVSSGKTCPDGFRIYPQLEEGTEETAYVKSEVYSFTPTSAQTETTCFIGYNYVSAKGTMTGNVLYILSLDYELEKIKDSGDTELSGKTIVCFGDSITGNYPPPLDYPSLLAKMTGATVYNVGFGGCCMSDNGQERRLFTMCRLVDSIVAGDFTPQSESGVSITYGGTSYNYVPDRIATLESIDWTKVDYITIAYGTNDWNSNYGLDNQSNPLDTTTYIGAFRYAIEKLLTAYPNIKVLPITPLWRWWDTNSGMPSGETGDYLDANTYAKGTGYYLWNYGNALIEAAKWYHIPVLDMYFNCMMNKQNRFQYFNTTDGTHPKLEGRILFAEILRSALESKY